MELWFEEALELERGITTKLKIKQHLLSRKTDYQQIDVLETTNFGRMLALDGIIMFTEFDEFCYQEMISHVPLITHPRPEKVLVIGGGDGGVIREVLKHDCVREAHLCEIDEGVVDVCREYFPNMASGLDDDRVTLHFRDGAEFVRENKGAFDVIIVDSSDPVGPAEVLFQKPFYKGMKAALRKNGIIVSQGESFFLHKNIIEDMYTFIKDLFPVVDYYYTVVPTYPSGLIGFYFCSLKHSPLKPQRIDDADGLDARYYSRGTHFSSFNLPPFVEEYFRDGVPSASTRGRSP